jgi:hypothetical protein
MNLVEINNSDYLDALQSVVYDHVEERFVNNANEQRRYALHLRCNDVTVKNVVQTENMQILFGTISERHFRHLLKIDERLLEIINSSPSFQEEDSQELVSVSSYVRQHSNGEYHIRLDIDDDPESKSYFFETAVSSNTNSNSSNSDEVNEIDPMSIQPGQKIDAVVHIVVTVDETRSECNFTSVIEEARVLPFEQPPKPKRKPTYLKA